MHYSLSCCTYGFARYYQFWWRTRKGGRTTKRRTLFCCTRICVMFDKLEQTCAVMIYILMSSDVHACMHATSFINMYEGFNLYNRFAKVVTFDAFNLIFCPALGFDSMGNWLQFSLLLWISTTVNTCGALKCYINVMGSCATTMLLTNHQTLTGSAQHAKPRPRFILNSVYCVLHRKLISCWFNCCNSCQ